jgi:hypothetical protein
MDTGVKKREGRRGEGWMMGKEIVDWDLGTMARGALVVHLSAALDIGHWTLGQRKIHVHEYLTNPISQGSKMKF